MLNYFSYDIVKCFSYSLTGGRHPNEDGEDGDPHTGETTRRGDPGMSQQDTRSSSQRAGALHKVKRRLYAVAEKKEISDLNPRLKASEWFLDLTLLSGSC